ncbi:hypothetical protein DPEC_G00098260 [Dallia pectoralis]|uniref:Uncharacterized protein n=1 Tax=Dallia pectoralis TaxID=75939 RepID=A0ACC2GVL8_DALPE|nr:hypothetical protein DPEC_G00098260 [Dallia pectoralis]
MAASLDIIISAECRYADLAADADPHDQCVACLGSDHARDGLLDPPECPSCVLLTMPRRRERRGFFDEVVPLRAVLSSDSEDSGEEEESSSEEERVAGSVRPVAPRQPPPAVSCVPRDRRSMREEDMDMSPIDTSPTPVPRPSLRSEFIGLIEGAALRMGIPLAPLPPAEEFDSMTGGPWSERVREPEPEAPCLPALAKYAEAAWREPLMARAPARAYMPFTRVAGRGEAITSATPKLERAMSAHLLPPKDWFTAQLVDKCFQFGAQSVAAANNLALMAGAISRITTGATSISAKELVDISRLSGTILHLNQAHAVCAGGTMATAAVTQRHLWLSLSSLKECQKAALLNAPVSTTGLFGEAVETATLTFKKVEADRILLSWHRPLARASRPDASRRASKSGASAKRRVRRQKLEAAAETAAPAPRAESYRPPMRGGHSKRPAAALAPRTISKCVETVLEPLRRRGVRVLAYLDDLLILALSAEMAMNHMIQLVELFTQLGCELEEERVVAESESNLSRALSGHERNESATVRREGGEYSLGLASVPTPLQEAGSGNHVPVRAHVGCSRSRNVGVAAYARPATLVCSTESRPGASPSAHADNSLYPGGDLDYWRNPAVLERGVPLGRVSAMTQVFTDASLTGWGGVCQGQGVGGVWPRSQRHINLLELETVQLVLTHFAPRLRGRDVLIRSDNRATVAYINRQGGVRSPVLHEAATRLWLWAHRHLRSLSAVHVPGRQNVGADLMSRGGRLASKPGNRLPHLGEIWGGPSGSVCGKRKRAVSSLGRTRLRITAGPRVSFTLFPHCHAWHDCWRG